MRFSLKNAIEGIIVPTILVVFIGTVISVEEILVTSKPSEELNKFII